MFRFLRSWIQVDLLCNCEKGEKFHRKLPCALSACIELSYGWRSGIIDAVLNLNGMYINKVKNGPINGVVD